MMTIEIIVTNNNNTENSNNDDDDNNNDGYTTVVLLMLVGFYIGSHLCQAVITICIYGLSRHSHRVMGM